MKKWFVDRWSCLPPAERAVAMYSNNSTLWINYGDESRQLSPVRAGLAAIPESIDSYFARDISECEWID